MNKNVSEIDQNNGILSGDRNSVSKNSFFKNGNRVGGK